MIIKITALWIKIYNWEHFNTERMHKHIQKYNLTTNKKERKSIIIHTSIFHSNHLAYVELQHLYSCPSRTEPITLHYISISSNCGIGNRKMAATPVSCANSAHVHLMKGKKRVNSQFKNIQATHAPRRHPWSFPVSMFLQNLMKIFLWTPHLLHPDLLCKPNPVGSGVTKN